MLNLTSKRDIQEMLVSMGFQPNYIQRGFKVHEVNFGHSYNLHVIIEIIHRLQKKDKTKINKKKKQHNINPKPLPSKSVIKGTTAHHYRQNIEKKRISQQDNKQNNKIAPFIPHMTMEDALKLSVDDKIEHRDQIGRFVLATIKDKQGSKLKIHYDGWSQKWDKWSDFSAELHRFAAAGSISLRASHRKHFASLKKGDFVDINPSQRHPGWKVGEIRRFWKKSGQVQVVYQYKHTIYLYWTHLDNDAEIAQYPTKSSGAEVEAANKIQRKEDAVDELKDETQEEKESFLREIEELNWKLIEVDADGNALYRCFAIIIYNDTTKHMLVRSDCCRYVRENKSFLREKQMKERRTEFKCRDHVVITALSELYNVRVRVFEYDIKQKKIIMSLDLGECKETVNLPLILLARYRKNHYNIICDPQSVNKRPLGTAEERRANEVCLKEIRLNEDAKQEHKEKEVKENDDDAKEEMNNLNANKFKNIYLPVVETWNLSPPLNTNDLQNCFDTLITQIHTKLFISVEYKKNKQILDRFWETQFNGDNNMDKHFQKWTKSLKEKIPNGKYPITVAVTSFNQSIVASIADNLQSIIEQSRERQSTNTNTQLQLQSHQNSQKQQQSANELHTGRKRKLDDLDVEHEPQKRRKENKELVKERNAFNVDHIDRMDEKSLDSLAVRINNRITELQEHLKQTKEAKDTLIERQLYCIACYENKRNIVFIQGCNHFVLCNDCYLKLDNKVCPQCRAPFNDVMILKI